MRRVCCVATILFLGCLLPAELMAQAINLTAKRITYRNLNTAGYPFQYEHMAGNASSCSNAQDCGADPMIFTYTSDGPHASNSTGVFNSHVIAGAGSSTVAGGNATEGETDSDAASKWNSLDWLIGDEVIATPIIPVTFGSYIDFDEWGYCYSAGGAGTTLVNRAVSVGTVEVEPNPSYPNAGLEEDSATLRGRLMLKHTRGASDYGTYLNTPTILARCGNSWIRATFDTCSYTWLVEGQLEHSTPGDVIQVFEQTMDETLDINREFFQLTKVGRKFEVETGVYTSQFEPVVSSTDSGSQEGRVLHGDVFFWIEAN